MGTGIRQPAKGRSVPSLEKPSMYQKRIRPLTDFAGWCQCQFNKPVGFYGLIMPPVPYAPSLECPRASIAARLRAAGSITISRRVSHCCCSNSIAGTAIGANFKMYLLRRFCWNPVEIFLQYTGNTDAKSDGPEF